MLITDRRGSDKVANWEGIPNLGKKRTLVKAGHVVVFGAAEFGKLRPQ